MIDSAVYMQLECELTDQEKIAYGRQMAQHMQEAAEVTAQLRSYQLSAKTKVAEHDASIATLSQALMSGKEMRRTECKWVYFWEEDEKRLIRLDTEDVVRKEPIRDEERQEKLDLDRDAD